MCVNIEYSLKIELTKKLFQWATPKELVNKNPEAWDSMAWADDYDQYLKSVDGVDLMENESGRLLPKNSGIGKMINLLKTLDETLHTEIMDEYKQILSSKK